MQEGVLLGRGRSHRLHTITRHAHRRVGSLDDRSTKSFQLGVEEVALFLERSQCLRRVVGVDLRASNRGHKVRELVVGNRLPIRVVVFDGHAHVLVDLAHRRRDHCGSGRARSDGHM